MKQSSLLGIIILLFICFFPLTTLAQNPTIDTANSSEQKLSIDASDSLTDNGEIKISASLNIKIAGTWQIDWDEKPKIKHNDKDARIAFVIPKSILTKDEHILAIHFTGQMNNNEASVTKKLLIKKKQQDETPDNETPDNETPDNETPENQTPENQTPDNETPENQTPDNETPDNQTPDNQTPDNQTPDNEIPENQTPDNDDSSDNNSTDKTTLTLGGPLPKTATGAPTGLLWGLLLFIAGLGWYYWQRKRQT